MTLQALALIGLAGLVGPLVALPRGGRVPLVIGELLAGVVLGATGFRVLHAGNATFTFLAEIGFALIMFVAGSHVPVRDSRLRGALRVGVVRALAVGALAAAAGAGVSAWFGTGHAALYAVLMASSSAALILPIVDGLKLTGRPVLELLPQIALADAACIVALPLAIDPGHAGRAALGALAVIACTAAVFVLLNWLERRGTRKRLHDISEDRSFAAELRINLVILFALAALAVRTHVSIMLAGFSYGLAIAAIGEPRRLARQLFAVADGFFGPLFFVWLGASLDLRALGDHPSYIGLGVVLGLGAVATHATMRLLGAQLPVAMLAAAQLGVPVAAATVGTQLHVLKPGEPAALILGALVTIAVATAAGAVAARQRGADAQDAHTSR
jgi:Kef-type K+ transport system membrane component KefB